MLNKLTRDNWKGPWAGVPIAWKDDDSFDLDTYYHDVSKCCEVGAIGVYTGGSTGEFFAIDSEEFRQVTRATIDACHAQGKHAMIGCTATYTKAAQKMAEFAAENGADAIQIALPYWHHLTDMETTSFIRDVSNVAGDLPLSLYDTGRSQKLININLHRRIQELLPNYLMIKSVSGSAGATPEGCSELSEFLNVFTSEATWSKLGRSGAAGSCSAMIYWNPHVVLQAWNALLEERWDDLNAISNFIISLHEFLFSEYGVRGFSDTAFDRLGTRANGVLKTSLRCRKPYTGPSEKDVESLRAWYRKNFPGTLYIDNPLVSMSDL
jgi:dihydrodipicolinate synthase/N-acetylneuraminate lyase